MYLAAGETDIPQTEQIGDETGSTNETEHEKNDCPFICKTNMQTTRAVHFLECIDKKIMIEMLESRYIKKLIF